MFRRRRVLQWELPGPMHDLSFFRGHLDAIAARLATRGFELNLEEFRSLDAERRAALAETEGLKAQRNAESGEIGKLRKQGVDEPASMAGSGH